MPLIRDLMPTYAPNKRPNSFLFHLLQVIESHKIGTLILSGDSNETIFPFLNKSPIPQSHPTDKQYFSKLITKYNLVDTWRELNPTKRQYTHYSYPCRSFSRIYHIFMSIGMTPKILNSKIVLIPLSDHSAIYNTIVSIIPKSRDSTWVLLLKNPVYTHNIEIALKKYLKFNSTPDISPTTLWEAHKPVLRGTCLCQANLFIGSGKSCVIL